MKLHTINNRYTAYPLELRKKAVIMYLIDGTSKSEIKRTIGMSYPVLDKWINKYGPELLMHKDLKTSKETIKNSLLNVYKLYSVRPNSYLARTFFDVKVDEIVSIFSGGPSIPVTDLVDSLNKISPTNASKWSQVKF